MSDIFKVSILNKSNGIDKIYVFYGSEKLHDGASEVSPTQYFKMEPNSDPFKNVFTDEELDSIATNSIDVEFINISIRLDDSIEEIKRKILMIFKNDISFDEIYLFSLKQENINLISSYQNITQNEKLDLTKERLSQFLLNFDNVDESNLLEKDEYDYDDLLSLNFEDKAYVKKPLGQKFFVNDMKYQYTVNPFDVIIYDSFLVKHAENIVTTQNRTLLLDFGKPMYNTIYCCLAEEVFSYIEEENIPNIEIGSTAKIYYPFLYKQNIYTLDQLRSNKIALIANNKAIINKYSEKKQFTTDLLYNIYDNREQDLNIKSDGIKHVNLIIHQKTSITLPIDVVFKLIHATETIPFIKLNPGSRKEKLYRIFTNSISSDGRKIPHLSKAVILKLSRDIGKTKRLAFYIENYDDNGIKTNTVLELDSTGDVYVDIIFPEPLSLDNCEELIQYSINPILTTIKEFIEQSGYNIELFNKISDKNIEIVEIKYNQLVSINKNIRLSKYVGCVSNCFNIIEDDLKKGIVMRYKKVSNFNIMSSQQALIIELVNKGNPRSEVITSLANNYNIDKLEAEEIYIRFINEVEIERGLYQNKRLKIRDNPGFLTTIKIDNFTNNIIIQVSNIDNVLYLDTIPKMLYSIISLTQNTYNQEYKSDVSRVCKKKTKEATIIADIVAPAEQQFQNRQKVKINDKQELTFIGEDDDEEEGDDDYLAMLLGVEDDDMGGGSTPEDDIVIGSDISIGSDSDNETTQQEGNIATAQEVVSIQPRLSQSGDDIEIGDSISMSPEKEEKSKTKTPEADVALQTAIHDSITEQDEFEKHPPADEHERDQINVSIKQQEDEERMNEDLEREVQFQTELNKDKSKREGDWNSLSKDSNDVSIPSSYEMEEDNDKENKIESPETPSPEESILPKPHVEVRRGLSLDSQQSSEGSIENDSISVGSDIDIDEMTKASSVKKSVDSLESLSVSPAESDDFEDFEKDITGTQLNNPYYFQARMERRDPVLFVKSMDDPKFKAYSRMCPSNVRRQPVILTEKEKERIDLEHPGSYSHAVKYGSDPSKQFYYICPRYWCIKDNTSLTEEEVNAGVCGGRDAIIPARASKIPKGKYIYEFNVKREHDDGKGNYIEHAPGFLSKKKHPKGMCLPCCFKNWNAPEQKRRRDACAQSQEDKSDEPLPVKRQTSLVVDDYIKDETKFPLEQNRWGVLPLILQNFLNVDKRNCALSGSKLPPNKECLLRHGVEVNKKQSFIACIADLYVEYISGNTIPTINEMKNIISEKVTLDIFMKCHNGNLVKIFSKESDEEIEIDSHSDSAIYNSLDLKNKSHMDFITKLVSSYNNFLSYLKDDDLVIDYRYLWDIVTGTGIVFPKGINLVILEITNSDSTQDVQVICPTNHYSNTFYDARNRSAFILLKQGNYYEPIYLYEDKETQIKVQKTFSDYGRLAPNLKKVLGTIKSHLQNKCRPLPSMPKVYNFVENKRIDEIISILDKMKTLKVKNITKTQKVNVDTLVMNYDAKIIGLIITHFIDDDDTMSGYIPCYPSGLFRTDIPVKIVDDPSIWKNYEETVAFLCRIKKASKNQVLCAVATKIIEEELVVGVLTETNQFIQLVQPEMPIDDNCPVVKDTNFMLTDIETMTNKNVDIDRIKYVKKIKLEKNFYDVFRNSIRILLNKYENRKVREQVQELVSNNDMYYNKMSNLIEILTSLLSELVEFIDYDENILMEMENVSSCLTSTECNKPYCMKTDNDNCKILIPRTNLLNELDNEVVYFAKISDELLRFNRIKLFIFDPKTHLNFGSINYNLNDNEIILLSSLLNQEYFKDLIPITNNSYVTSNTYDTANPIKTQTYSSVLGKKKQGDNDDCHTEESKKVSGAKWRKLFSAGSKEIIFENSIICTYNVILNILNKADITNKTINVIRGDLLIEYSKLFDQGHRNQILKILKHEGKFDEVDLINQDKLSFESWILSENYHLTNLDIWLLAKLYNLGIILISSTKFATSNNEDILPLNYSDNGEYYFIKSPGKRKNKIPKYKLIVDGNNSCKFIFSDLKSELQKPISLTKTADKGYTLERYLREFEPIVYQQKKRLVLVNKLDGSVKKAKKKTTKLKLKKTKKDGN